MCVSVFHDLTELDELVKNTDDVACIDNFFWLLVMTKQM